MRDYQQAIGEMARAQQLSMETYSRRMKAITDSLVRTGVSQIEAMQTAAGIAGREMQPKLARIARDPEEKAKKVQELFRGETSDEGGQNEGSGSSRPPFLLRALSGLSGSIGHILFYVGVIGLIQALVSRRTNRGMNAAYATACRIAQERK